METTPTLTMKYGTFAQYTIEVRPDSTGGHYVVTKFCGETIAAERTAERDPLKVAAEAREANPCMYS